MATRERREYTVRSLSRDLRGALGEELGARDDDRGSSSPPAMWRLVA